MHNRQILLLASASLRRRADDAAIAADATYAAALAARKTADALSSASEIADATYAALRDACRLEK